MNERIKELVIQAKQHANHLDSIGVDASMEDIFNQKFAELIVQKCADIADSIGEHGYIASEEMLEQFGVK